MRYGIDALHEVTFVLNILHFCMDDENNCVRSKKEVNLPNFPRRDLYFHCRSSAEPTQRCLRNLLVSLPSATVVLGISNML